MQLICVCKVGFQFSFRYFELPAFLFEIPFSLWSFNLYILCFIFLFRNAVVWNPWDKKAKAMVDFGDEEYKHMLCVEAAAIEKPITLKPGEEWRGRQELSAVPSSYCSGQLDPQKVLQGSWKIRHSGPYPVQVLLAGSLKHLFWI